MNSASVATLLVASLPLLRAYVRRIAGSHQLAGDLLQDVSVRILAGAGPTDPRDFLAWCFGIARHALSYEWRMQKRAREAVALEGDLVEAISSTDFDPDNQADARAWLARAAAQIDSEELDLLVRRYVLEETGKELADDLGQSSAALRMRLMRLRAALNDRSSRG
jgi:RNA polymerase sigma factor (sigma-70 family)